MASQRPGPGGPGPAPARRFAYVVGTRPNFMKMAPLVHAMRRRCPADRHVIVHTGQHYDVGMSRTFFEQLELAAPDHHLGVGGTPRPAQIALTTRRLAALLARERPDVVVVGGDSNSTLAGALAARTAGVRVAHLESGLRSFDLDMPEEVNRIVVDHASDLLFTHSPEARENLLAEGRGEDQIHACGNTMIDALLGVAPPAGDRAALARHGIGRPYLLVTLHRPALVDRPALGPALRALDSLGAQMEVVFPVHPRTARALAGGGAPRRVRLLSPLPPADFVALERNAAAVLTDSGGVQEETTFLGVPCFTLRDNTERPITVSRGTNRLLGLDPQRILELPGLIDGRPPRPARLPGWDGRAAQRIAAVLDAALAPAGPPALAGLAP